MEKPVIDWLLEPEEPEVRYLALRDLAGAGGKELRAAREQAHREGPIAAILSEMNPEGYWVKPGPGYSPKYRSGVWSLISLAQLGASLEEDARLAKACDYLLNHALTEQGQIAYNGQPSGTIDCLQGNILASLWEIGFRDGRLDTAWEWMARTVTGEGIAPMSDEEAPLRYYHFKRGPGFICGINSNLPCGWGAAKVTLAFSRLPAEKRTGLIERAVDEGIRFLFSAEPATAAYPCGNGRPPDYKWKKFHFPVFYVADILQVAEALTSLGLGADPRLANTLELIRRNQDENGRWPLEYDYRNRMWLNYGSRGKPNKWVTLRALRVLEKAAADGWSKTG